MTRILHGLVALAFGLAGAQGPTQGASSSMTTREQVAALLQKSAPALLQGDPKALLKLELDVSDIAFRGLEVLAPATVPAGAPLPIVVLMQKSSMRGRRCRA
jgi:hypothetical protein